MIHNEIFILSALSLLVNDAVEVKNVGADSVENVDVILIL